MKNRPMKIVKIGSPEWNTLMTAYLAQRNQATPDLKKTLEKLGLKVTAPATKATSSDDA